ncbi:helix-turn-helix domain-containing protein [Methylophilaceae bacterium]|nr:helix-turn-helix domain-containing protein [Methylophilaceae bacterium]
MANNTNNYFVWRKTFTADDRLSSTTRLVMHAIHRYMDVKTLEAYPSRSTLAEDTGLSIKSISKHTEAAEKLGWLKKIKSKQPGNQFINNIYKGLYPKQASLSSPKMEPDDLTRESKVPQVENEGNTNYPETYPYNSAKNEKFDKNEKKIELIDVGEVITIRESQVKTRSDLLKALITLNNGYAQEGLIDWVIENDFSEIKSRDQLPTKYKYKY